MSCCFSSGSDIGGGVSSPCGIFRSSVQAFATVPTTTATAVQAPAAGLLKSQQQYTVAQALKKFGININIIIIIIIMIIIITISFAGVHSKLP